MLVLALILVASAVPDVARAQHPAATTPSNSASTRTKPGRIDTATLAKWGVAGRVITGKIPTLNIVVDRRKVLANWRAIRASGLAQATGDAGWAQAHPVAACTDVALAAIPTVLHEIYHDDDTLDYAPVYVLLDSADFESGPKQMLSLNVNRAMVRKMRGRPLPAAKVAFMPWLEAQLHHEQR